MTENILTIHSLSPLGEGIAHQNDTIYYVPKTCPGDEIQIDKSKKIKKNIIKVNQYTLLKKSRQRQDPACPHFDQCGGCDYMHISYEDEISNKLKAFKMNLQRGLRDFSIPNIQVHPAKKRTHYRNRIQLQVKNNKFGFMERESHQISLIENCLLAIPAIQETLTSKKFLQNLPSSGHVEVAFIENQIKTFYNQNYAAAGFSQVNHEMNEVLKSLVHHFYHSMGKKNDAELIELFSGGGNLSKSIINLFKQSWHIDAYDFSQQIENQNFVKLNLFKDDLWEYFEQNSILQNKEASRHLLLDPPRSGHKELAKIVNHFVFDSIVYVSCNYSSMIRDLKPLAETYQLKQIHLIDMFPSTKHFEVMAILLKNDSNYSAAP